jgi:protein-L-isoaspartate(D-aspartate) O-methyltransferase
MNLPLNSLPEHHSAQAHARYNMIEQQIRPWNVLDEEVLALLGKVRRENFVPPEHAGLAFMDLEIPLVASADEAAANGWCMLAPRIEARMLQDLQIKPTDRVLEIGAGSGYMAALLAAQAGKS